MQIRKATRKQAKLRLALCAVAGSGKSLGAILISKGLGGKFIVIDTENNSADLYAHVADYDVLQLAAPYSPDRYIEAIKTCEKAGYRTIIIDSLTHAWSGDGGILDIQDKAAKISKSANSYMAWRTVTPQHNRLVDAILASDCHIIATMRSKVHHDIIDINGKKAPVKIGLAPIQREGMDYEFTTVLDIDQASHLYSCSKDRTNLFDGKNEKITEETGKMLLEWLDTGVSFEDVKKQSLDEIAINIMESESEDDLKSKFFEAIRLHPTLRDDITVFKDKRKKELSVDGRLANMQEKMTTYANTERLKEWGNAERPFSGVSPREYREMESDRVYSDR